MGQILVSGIRAYGHHGCLDEEAVIGQEYTVDVTMECDLRPSAEADNLSLTVDYCDVTRIVKEEVGQRSKLIETVAMRIAKKILTLDFVQKVTVAVTKPKPPIDGDVKQVTVIETLSK
jgi:dihydroneopterin aldolase